MFYNNIMLRRTSVPSFFPLLALTFFLLSVSYIVTHLRFPYDGARLEPGQQAWLSNGILVRPLTRTADGLQTDDLILAVDGTQIDQYAESLVGFRFFRGESYFDQVVEYSILRNGVKMDIRAPQTTYPMGALLARYWGIYIVVLVLQGIMTYVLIRQPSESAAQVLFVLAWSLWHFPTWTVGLQISDIVTGWGYWHYRVATLLPYLLTFSAMVHLSLLFPKQHPILGRNSRLIPILYIAPYALFSIFMAIAKFFTSNPWIWLGYWNAGEWAVSILYMSVFIVMTILNYRTVPDEGTRVKVRWVVFGGSVSAAGIVLLWLFPGVVLGQPVIPAGALALLALPVPLTLAVAIMRYQLFDIDVVINRALVYGMLTAIIVGLYMTIVGYVGTLFHTRAIDHSQKDILLSLVAAGLTAAIFQPLRDHLQRAINRFMYGERDDPYTVLARLGQKLEATESNRTILPTIVETIAQALKLPYVAILFNDHRRPQLVAAYGTPPNYQVTKYPLVYQNESFGELVLVQRSETESFNSNEQQLLADLAREVGVAAYNVRLTADLQRSREQLVMSREEERRRIRRDLHDELGPVLASLSLKLDAARNRLRGDPDGADSILLEIKSQTQVALGDIRRLVYNLRPPALDELGFLSAIKEYANSQSDMGLSIKIEHDHDFPDLPAAVEVAAYRIIIEALNNISKHAEATKCLVRLSGNGELQIDITDNGIGIPKGFHSGVGTRSMQERAAELGGECMIQPEVAGGTRVIARLPYKVIDYES
ncbi:MAG TPA: GAF domain-containing sensor histidine kinase [Anaerolineales bacterium]|nr:GAF domain-containing sensor histidine kinase [Anaerolineales bacterium]